MPNPDRPNKGRVFKATEAASNSLPLGQVVFITAVILTSGCVDPDERPTDFPTTYEHFGLGMYARESSALYWGVVTGEHPLVPAKPSANCAELEESEFAALSYKLIELEVQGLSSAELAWDNATVGFVELVADGYTPFVNQGIGGLFGLRLPASSWWEQRSPMLANDLPYVDAGPDAADCTASLREDAVGFGDFTFPVWREAEVWPKDQKMIYRGDEVEVCAFVPDPEQPAGTFVFEKHTTVVELKPKGFVGFEAVRKAWCWPREEVECFIVGSIEKSNPAFDCAALIDAPIPNVDGGWNDVDAGL
jgi:hypothetical protein